MSLFVKVKKGSVFLSSILQVM